MKKFCLPLIISAFFCMELCAAIANPSSTNCADKGGHLITYESDQGDVGICYISKDQCCEEWAMFRRDDKSCPPGGIPFNPSWKPPKDSKYICQQPDSANGTGNSVYYADGTGNLVNYADGTGNSANYADGAGNSANYADGTGNSASDENGSESYNGNTAIIAGNGNNENGNETEDEDNSDSYDGYEQGQNIDSPSLVVKQVVTQTILVPIPSITPGANATSNADVTSGSEIVKVGVSLLIPGFVGSLLAMY